MARRLIGVAGRCFVNESVIIDEGARRVELL